MALDDQGKSLRAQPDIRPMGQVPRIGQDPARVRRIFVEDVDGVSHNVIDFAGQQVGNLFKRGERGWVHIANDQIAIGANEIQRTVFNHLLKDLG